MMMKKTAAMVLLSAMTIYYVLREVTRLKLPKHMCGHPVIFEENFLREDVARSLRDLTKEMKTFPTNVNDLKFYKTEHEHIGEATEITTNGTCDHPFLVPSIERSKCVLPGRIDIGKHWILSGGVNGIKESYKSMISRIQSFGRYNFDFSQYDVVQELFRDPKFVKMAQDVCPKNKQHLDAFQFNFIIQVPGQTVAAHIDGAYFWGATRFQFPQWLLAAMVYSGLWQDQFVDQVQIVAYYHDWSEVDIKDVGGRFFYWNQSDGKSFSIPPTSLAGSAVDGSKTVHAASVYRPDVSAPHLNKDHTNILEFVEGETWLLRASIGTSEERNYTYHTRDLRMSVVYRARCFENEDRAELFQGRGGPELLDLDSILKIFAKDLTQRGKLSHEDDIEHMPRLDLAMLIIKTYIQYPFSRISWFPFNFCALDRLVPVFRPILSCICK